MWFSIEFSVACLLIHTTKSLLASTSVGRLNDDDDLIVELVNPSGKIRGHILQTGKGNDYYAFQDIPYAKPPVGENRFKHPQPLDPWTDVLDTVANVKYCPQEGTGTEDCLVLNVYTPLKPGSNALLPVLFMIHGGGYSAGSGSIDIYNPQYFIEQEIVVVTINYRLGVLGFLTMDDKNLPGNLGLRDQHFALKWTRDNIHLFNGDPNQITINGESAGAMSVGQQFISEQNEGWIKGVIAQSGSGFGTTVIQTDFIALALQFGKGLDTNFNSNKSEDLLKLLLQSSTEDIIRLQTEMQDFEEIKLKWNPIIESEANENTFLTGPLHNRILTGQFNLVPLMIGFNSEEFILFVQGWTDEQFAAASKIYDDDARMLIPESLNVAEEDREQAGLDLKALYTTSFVGDKAAYIRYYSDTAFTRPIAKQAEGASQYVPVYLYEWSWNENPEKYSGVPHAYDIMYLWDAPSFDTDYPINETFRTAVIKLWCNFIKTQNPTPETDEDIQNIIWPQVQPNAVKYLNLNKTFEILENPRKYYEIRNILDNVIQPPFNVY